MVSYDACDTIYLRIVGAEVIVMKIVKESLLPMMITIFINVSKAAGA